MKLACHRVAVRALALGLLLAAGPTAAAGAAPPPSVPNAVTCAAICSWSAPGFDPPDLVDFYLPLGGGCPDLLATAPSEPGDYPVTLQICCVGEPLNCSEQTHVVTVLPTPLLSDGFESGGFALWLVGEGV